MDLKKLERNIICRNEENFDFSNFKSHKEDNVLFDHFYRCNKWKAEADQEELYKNPSLSGSVANTK